MFPVGIDVSKNTLNLCMLYNGIKISEERPLAISANGHNLGFLDIWCCQLNLMTLVWAAQYYRRYLLIAASGHHQPQEFAL